MAIDAGSARVSGRRVPFMAQVEKQEQRRKESMNAREAIFAKVKAATNGLEAVTPLPTVEEILSRRPRQVPTTGDFDTLAACFAQRWEEAHGKQFANWSELLAFLQSKEVKRGYADPKAAKLLG